MTYSSFELIGTRQYYEVEGRVKICVVLEILENFDVFIEDPKTKKRWRIDPEQIIPEEDSPLYGIDEEVRWNVQVYRPEISTTIAMEARMIVKGILRSDEHYSYEMRCMISGQTKVISQDNLISFQDLSKWQT